MATSSVIGIDLGTTNSCVAVYKNGKIEVIANDEGPRTTPSAVAFNEEEILVGAAAKEQTKRNPKNTIYNVKRLIGRKFFDAEVQKEIKNFSYKVENNNSKPVMSVEFKNKREQFTPEQISAFILQKMKTSAEKHLDRKVTEAVITVPAYFNDGQRQATKDAATIAGLNAIRIINEPTAAAMAYALENDVDRTKNVFIFDLGGGTFDVSIVRVSQKTKFEVIATTGDTHLGGADFDQLLFFHFAAEFQEKTSLNVTTDPRAMRKLQLECENAKIRLSTSFEATVDIEALMNGQDFISKIKKARFEELCKDLFARTIEKTEQALKDARLKKEDIDDVVLVGGSTRIPKIQKIVKEFFNGKEPKRSVNVDEAVAYGAAVQATRLSNAEDIIIKNVELLDVIPLSLGLKTGDTGRHSVVIRRNTSVPISASKTFTNNGRNQKSVVFEVYEGENDFAEENHKLGEFSLDNIPEGPANTIHFDVTFSIDVNGILSVSAVEKSTGKRKSVTIKNKPGRLSKKEVDRMTEDARRFKKEANDRRERTKARDDFESYTDTVRCALDNRRNRLSRTAVENAQRALEAADDWLGSNKNAEKNEIYFKWDALKEVCDSLLDE